MSHATGKIHTPANAQRTAAKPARQTEAPARAPVTPEGLAVLTSSDQASRQQGMRDLQATQGNRYAAGYVLSARQEQETAQMERAVSDPLIAATIQRQVREGQIERPVNSVDLSPLSSNANKIKEAASKISEVALVVREDGTHFYGNEKDKINMAANLTDMASKLMSAASAMENMKSGVSGGRLEGPADVLDKATKLLRAADLIGGMRANEAALLELKAHPGDFAKAEAWANSIGETFSRAQELIPDSIPGLPGFIPQYFKGLLNAPKNYIQVFIALQKDRNARIDSETGGSTADRRVVEGEKVVWEGELCGIFYGGFFAQPPGLQDFMRANRHIGGVDLWKASFNLGKALLVGAVEHIEDDTKRLAWSDYVNSH